MFKPTVSLVIPVWNSLSQLQAHLKPTLEVCKKEGIQEFILVDDASTDRSVNFINKFTHINPIYPITLIEKSTNKGFSHTVNTGAKVATGKILFLLNTDALPQKGFLQPALKHFRDQKVFSISCNDGGAPATGHFQRGFFWHKPNLNILPSLRGGTPLKSINNVTTRQSRSKFHLTPRHSELVSESNSQEVNKLKNYHLTLWTLAGNGFYRKSMWDKLGGLDEIYDPFYWEDIDLGYRALKRGWLNLWEPNSHVSHQTTSGVIKTHFPESLRNYYSRRNHFLFMWKNITDPKLIASHLAWLPYYLIRHPSYVKPFLAALSQSPKILRSRLLECRQSQLSDHQILSLFKT